MGGRLLRKWLGAPLIDIQRIRRRQDAVESLLDELLRGTANGTPKRFTI